MSRYIDADAIKEKAWKAEREACFYALDDVVIVTDIVVSVTDMDEAPSIDIVRCKECRYKNMDICAMYRLSVAGVRKPDDFCSYGERRE